MDKYTLTPSLIANFWERVEKTESCWPWTGTLTPEGYGQLGLHVEGKYRTVCAHKLSYLVAGQSLAANEVVDHRCHNHACVNPSHLRAATRKQNAEHRLGAQRNNKSSGVRGVYWHEQAHKWRAMVRHNRRLISAGLFDTVAEAQAAVVSKRNELFTFNDVDRAGWSDPALI